MSHENTLRVRPAAGDADLVAIAAIAMATGQDEDWDQVYPAYLTHLVRHGSLLVAERAGVVTGYGATIRIGTGEQEICMLTDLFVDPSAHGAGTGRAILSSLWHDAPRRITFSSLHAHALPLYTSFGLDAWWPLLYLSGDVGRLRTPEGWSVTTAAASRVAELELSWTGFDRTAEHEFWVTWPGGAGVIASLDGRPVAAGSVGGAGSEYGICHLAMDAGDGAGRDAGAENLQDIGKQTRSGAGTGPDAADAVIAVLSSLEPAGGQARVCLPAPHPATRRLLGAGWRVEEFDLHMATRFGLIDPLRTALSPGLA